MQPQFDPKQRVPEGYEDILHIYKARIVDAMNPGDDRLEVRIIPHMVGLPEGDPLPKYPPFFKGQVISGKSEKRDQATQADYVWVAATTDFTVGFVIGLANVYERPGTKYSNSYNYNDLIVGLQEKGALPEYVKYQDLYVQYWHENYIEMVNSRTGDKYIIQSTGNMIILEKNQIYLRVGDGKGARANPPEKPNRFSAIRITRDELSIVSPHIRLRGEMISVGEAGLYLAAIASSIDLSVQGATIHPIRNTRA